MKGVITDMGDGRVKYTIANKSIHSDDKQKIFNNLIRSVHPITILRGGRRTLRVAGLFVIYDPLAVLTGRVEYALYCNNKRYVISNKNGLIIRLKKFILIWHNTELPYDDFFDAEIHNTIFVSGKTNGDIGFMKPMQYSFFDRNKGTSRNKRIKLFPDRSTSIFFRQTRSNGLCVTTRRSVVSDRKRNRSMIYLAWLLSRFAFWRKVSLIYEKESQRYEESGSVLYEALVDGGYKNFYYVIDKDSNQYTFIKNEYQKNIVFKNTFRHYYYYFVCENFIGTESPSHAIDLRVANRKVLKKLESKKYTHVFLQHGVFYMVSMASEARKHYALKKTGYFPTGRTHIVVGSDLEAQHFIDGGGFAPEDMYLTGLPKFDRAYRKDSASKIVIMPTWRPWEYNIVRTDPENSPYYKMLLEILSGVPDDLKQYVHILPHPLFIRELSQTKIGEYIKPYDSYDQVLRETDLLITDYSSIAYDAFYRGSNVIFWWKEKDHCMEQYGGHLMINEENIWGDITYGTDTLAPLVMKHYKNTQPEKFVEKYRQIVNFYDNKNTDRLINLLRKDNII